MDPNTSSALEQQIAQLTSRVYRLESALRHHGISFEQEPAATPALAEQEVTHTALLDAQPQEIPPVSGTAPPMTEPLDQPQQSLLAVSSASSTDDSHSLESRIASQWFNRIGIVAVLIGMAWFLKLAIDNHWIGDLGRILIGLIAGAGLIAWSERFFRHGYRGFSYSLKAVGSGILYLSLWAAFSVYHLIPSSVAFVAMVIVTAFNGFMAWIQDAELIALYAIVGGLSTPLLLSTGENREISLFSYLLLLDIAVLVLAALRPWSRLVFVTFVGTAIFIIAWWAEFYSRAAATPTAIFLTCFFLIFAFAPRLIRLKSLGNETLAPWDSLTLIVLPVANAALAFLAFYDILEGFRNEWTAAWLAVGFAAFYLALMRLPARSVFRDSPALLSKLHLTTAVVFLSIAIPLKAHGRWLTIGWLVEGGLLFWVATRIRSILLRVLALLCLILGLVALLTVDPTASTAPIFNQRFGTYCVAIAVCAFIARVSARVPDESTDPDNLWTQLPFIASLAVSVLILIALSLEIHSFWWIRDKTSAWAQGLNYSMYAQFTYSALFMAYGAILLCIGFWRRSAFVRWQALVLLAVAIGKVFLIDVSQLSQGYRILSFIGLGALLLSVSFVYQRDWLHLRGHRDTP